MNITLVSYCDKLDFGIIACRRSLPQIQRIIDHLEDAFQELEAVAGIGTGAKSPRKAASRKIGRTGKAAATKKRAATAKAKAGVTRKAASTAATSKGRAKSNVKSAGGAKARRKPAAKRSASANP